MAINWKLTEEAKALIPAHNRKWIERIMSTAAMTVTDREATRTAVVAMYALIGKPAPRIVFVSSPLQAAVVAGAAAAWWHTRSATSSATSSATRTATSSATDYFQLHLDAALSVVGDTPLARACIARAWAMKDGGNEWGAWCCYLSFVRDVVGWSHEIHANYTHYETCAIRSGVRYSHPEFCVVSDRPCTLVVDRQNRLHNPNGPAKAWRDGWSLYYLEGVPVPSDWIMEGITLGKLKAERNAEVRRVGIEQYGRAKWLRDTGAKLIDADVDDRSDARALVRDAENLQWLICTDGSTGRVYSLRVPDDVQTCREAYVALCGLRGNCVGEG